MTAVVTRIILRYGAGYLVLHGLISAADGKGLATDPDAFALAETVMGLAVAGITEFWYWLAKRFGWKV